VTRVGITIAIAAAVTVAAGLAGSGSARTGTTGDCSCAWFQVWGEGGDNANALALGPGFALYVTGFTDLASFATIRYDGVTGMPGWITRLGGSGMSAPYMNAAAIAAAPVGNRVFVTGFKEGDLSGPFGYATLAYDASSGVLLWQRYFTGPANDNRATGIAVSPDGSTVFVTGWSTNRSGDADLLTIAYSASTGNQLWHRRWAGGGPGSRPVSILASPDGSSIYVTGRQGRAGDGWDYLTIAYGASDGKPLWVQRFDDAAHGNDFPVAETLSRDGSRLYVTGTSLRPDGTGQHSDAATLAYDARLGTRLWIRRYPGPGGDGATAGAIGVTPDGSRIFITGTSGPEPASDFATVAYTPSGAQAWVRRYESPVSYPNGAAALAVAPDSSAVYVTGNSYGGATSWDITTLAYDAVGGNQLWVKRFDTGPNYEDVVASIGVSPDGKWLYLAGHTGPPEPSVVDQYFLTLAYAIP
jgi:DNA-binding beta-propeller fold protein YncE